MVVVVVRGGEEEPGQAQRGHRLWGSRAHDGTGREERRDGGKNEGGEKRKEKRAG